MLVPLLEDELAAGDAIAALRRYSLISPAGDGLVSVHRLVQAVTADSDARRAGPGVAAGRRRRDRGRDPRRHRSSRRPGPMCAALLPHAQAGSAADQQRHGADRDLPRLQRQLRAARDLFQLIADAAAGTDASAPSTRTP